jgi:methyl-accepting chemotaxis protein
MFPQTEAVLHDYARNKFEIPTIDSPFAEFSKTFQVMPISKIVQDIHGITKTLDKDLPPILKQMNSAITSLNNILSDNKNGTSQMVQQIGEAAQSFDALVDENSANISHMVESFSQAAKSLKNLTDYLQMNPSAIITGKDY